MAIAAGVSLREAEEALEELVSLGRLRRARPDEMHRTDPVIAYVKVV